MSRIHILGASGSGTTTLGAAVAARRGCPHEDSDDFFWLPTDPPYTTARQARERRALLLPRLEASRRWVLSGSAINWGLPDDRLYDLIVFLRLDPTLRMARLRQRETARYGARIEAGGDMVVASHAFLDWAEAYDTADTLQRSLMAHEQWLAERACPVLRLDSAAPVEALVAAVLAHPAAVD